MWAQQWHDRYFDFAPFPDTPLVDITEALHKNKYSIHKLYTTSEAFFTSIGLYPMTPKFWARSLFKKPVDRDVVCHPSASNMGYHDDYRVKICTELNDDYFIQLIMKWDMWNIIWLMTKNNHMFIVKELIRVFMKLLEIQLACMQVSILLKYG
jgi:hypothetical protein